MDYWKDFSLVPDIFWFFITALLLIVSSHFQKQVNNNSEPSNEDTGDTWLSRLFEGRLNRRTFYVGIVVTILFVVSPLIITNNPIFIFWILASFPVALVFFSTLTIRRAHDRGEEGHGHTMINAFTFFDEFANLVLEGEKRQNKYGHQPGNKVDFMSLFFGTNFKNTKSSS